MINQHVDMTTVFQMRVFKEDGTLKEETAPFRNIILNTGLDLMAKKSGYASWIAVGTGNSEPTATQTGLDSLYLFSNIAVGEGSTVVYEPTPVPRYKRTITRRCSGFNNTNLTEVSLGYAINHTGGIAETSQFTSWNRALIKDALGKPTTITLLPDEFLEVTAVTYYYPTVSDQKFTVTIDDKGSVSTHDVVVRPSELGKTPRWGLDSEVRPVLQDNSTFELWNGSIGVITSKPTGQFLGGTDQWRQSLVATNLGYVDGSYKRVGHIHCPLDSGNGNTTAMFIETTLGCYQASITPAVTKNNQQVMGIEITLSWGRYEGAL